ncbi:MAG: hypothetical protein ABIR26_13660 [Ramlibacter sp.]
MNTPEKSRAELEEELFARRTRRLAAGILPCSNPRRTTGALPFAWNQNEESVPHWPGKKHPRWPPAAESLFKSPLPMQPTTQVERLAAPAPAASSKGSPAGCIGRRSVVQVLAEVPRAIGRAVSNFGSLFPGAITPAKSEERARAAELRARTGVKQDIGSVLSDLRNLTTALSSSDGQGANATFKDLQHTLSLIAKRGGDPDVVLGWCVGSRLKEMAPSETAALSKALGAAKPSGALGELCDLVNARIAVSNAMQKSGSRDATFEKAQTKDLTVLKQAADLLLQRPSFANGSAKLENARWLSHVTGFELAARTVEAYDNSEGEMALADLTRVKAAVDLLLKSASNIPDSTRLELEAMQVDLSLKLIDGFGSTLRHVKKELNTRDRVALLAHPANLNLSLLAMQMYAPIDPNSRTDKRQEQLLKEYCHALDSAIQEFNSSGLDMLEKLTHAYEKLVQLEESS